LPAGAAAPSAVAVARSPTFTISGLNASSKGWGDQWLQEGPFAGFKVFSLFNLCLSPFPSEKNALPCFLCALAEL
jgi:hypothetical protein